MSETVQQTDVTFLLSSMVGFGHASRAIAIAQAVEFPQPLTLVADQTAASFLSTNLRDYPAPMHQVELDYHYLSPDDEFVDRNQHLVEHLQRSRIIVNDFLSQNGAIKRLIQQAGITAPLYGVYHSITGYQSSNPEVSDFQIRTIERSKQLDRLYAAELSVSHGEPYRLSSGTEVLPCPPIVRKPTVPADDVKRQLGLDPEEEFIYVQGGGVIMGTELSDIVGRLGRLTLPDMKFVVSSSSDKNITASDTVIPIAPRPDGQNLIAASSGVITKPGMGTICEAVANRKSLLLVDYPAPEAYAKYDMIRQLIGDKLPFILNRKDSLEQQLQRWRHGRTSMGSAFSQVDCDGAQIIARDLVV